MAAKLGSTDVSFRLGATTPAKVYLGTQEVWSAATVPGAPAIVSATLTGPLLEIVFSAPASDGGSAITGYRFFADNQDITSDLSSGPDPAGGNLTASFFTGLVDGASLIRISAINAIGEGPSSESFPVTEL